MRDLTDETLEWELADEELGRLLITTDLTESDGSWLIPVGLLDTSGGWSALAGCLAGKLLSWGLSSRRFACELHVSMLVLMLRECRSDVLLMESCQATITEVAEVNNDNDNSDVDDDDSEHLRAVCLVRAISNDFECVVDGYEDVSVMAEAEDGW